MLIFLENDDTKTASNCRDNSDLMAKTPDFP